MDRIEVSKSIGRKFKLVKNSGARLNFLWTAFHNWTSNSSFPWQSIQERSEQLGLPNQWIPSSIGAKQSASEGVEPINWRIFPFPGIRRFKLAAMTEVNLSSPALFHFNRDWNSEFWLKNFMLSRNRGNFIVCFIFSLHIMSCVLSSLRSVSFVGMTKLEEVFEEKGENVCFDIMDFICMGIYCNWTSWFVLALA